MEGWEKLVGEGTAITVLVVILIFILRSLPTWKEIKLAESDATGKLATSIGALAQSQTNLAQSQSQLAQVVSSIAIEQRRATEEVRILQRVNSSVSQDLTEAVTTLTERIDQIEQKYESRNIKKITN